MRALLVGIVLVLSLAASCEKEQPRQPPEAPAGAAQAAHAPATPESPPAAAPLAASSSGPDLPPGAVPLAVDQPGTLTLPMPGLESASETHTRHPWTMPEGKRNVMAVVHWQDNSWKDIKVDVGVGICPHRGKTLATATASGGMAAVLYNAEGDSRAEDPNWFLHVNADANLADKTGETLAYTYSIHAW